MRERISRTITVSVAATLLAALLLWGVTAAASSKLDTSRFVTDSISRDGQFRSFQSRQQADSTVLRRIDERVRAMYCGSVPLPNRAGCQ